MYKLRHRFLSSKRYHWFLVYLFFLSPSAVWGQKAISWSVKPSYQTLLKDTDTTALSIPDEQNVQYVFYDNSYAILIINGAYNQGGWAGVSDTAKRNENLLRESLEKRGFDVLVWRDLTGTQMRAVLSEAFSNLGYGQNSRLFFYYYGHGQLMGTDEDPFGTRTFLVPIDAPNPVSEEFKFYRVALPLTQIVEYAKEIRVKHAFFALEACQAGSLIASLAGPQPPYPKGYLLGPKVQKPIRQFLTAGSPEEDVLADSPFTPLLVGALENGDSNGDGYVTGSEVFQYVTAHVPQNTKFQNPENGSLPKAGGDLVFGAVSPQTNKTPALAAVTTKEETVTRDWRSPQLNVGCNETRSGRFQAAVPLDSSLNEKVVSTAARYEGTDKIQGVTGPTIESGSGPSRVVSYGFNGLDSGFLGCPGGGHATVVVSFVITRTVPVVNAQ